VLRWFRERKGIVHLGHMGGKIVHTRQLPWNVKVTTNVYDELNC
jgi:hypothetical protein